MIITYYGRDAKQKMMDTVHQHARMFGYRQELKDVTRLFLPERILEDFRAIHEADEGMRQAIGDDPSNIKIKPVWVGSKLKPTRSNVLNPAEIDTFTPGSHIFPRAALYKSADVREHTEALKELLVEYENNQYHKVDIDSLIKILSHLPSNHVSGEKWEDKRVKQALKVIKVEGVQEGLIYVRRGKNDEGLELTRQDPNNWGSFGFVASRLLTDTKSKYPDVPTLIISYQKGDKNPYKWDDESFYLPMLILPKSKFVFMFNYSEAAE